MATPAKSKIMEVWAESSPSKPFPFSYRNKEGAFKRTWVDVRNSHMSEGVNPNLAKGVTGHLAMTVAQSNVIKDEIKRVTAARTRSESRMGSLSRTGGSLTPRAPQTARLPTVTVTDSVSPLRELGESQDGHYLPTPPSAPRAGSGTPSPGAQRGLSSVSPSAIPPLAPSEVMKSANVPSPPRWPGSPTKPVAGPPVRRGRREYLEFKRRQPVSQDGMASPAWMPTSYVYGFDQRLSSAMAMASVSEGNSPASSYSFMSLGSGARAQSPNAPDYRKKIVTKAMYRENGVFSRPEFVQ